MRVVKLKLNQTWQVCSPRKKEIYSYHGSKQEADDELKRLNGDTPLTGVNFVKKPRQAKDFFYNKFA
jgi:hypothetical protein